MENLGYVSVIVPIYNVENMLNRCIDSLLNQTYPYLEIILVDDGSPDHCGEICDTYAAQDSRIKVIHKSNAGLGLARNSGLEIATGEYVLFVDSDDYVSGEHVEKLIVAITEDNADMVVSGYIRNFSSGKRIVSPSAERKTIIANEQIVSKGLLPILGAAPDANGDVDRPMCVWINMYKRSIIERLNLRFLSEREYVSEDLFFNIGYIYNTKIIAMLPECTYYYSENASSLTHTFRQDRYEKYCKMLQYETELLQSMGVYNVSKYRVYRTFIMKTKKCIAQIACSNLKLGQMIQSSRIILYDHVLENVVNEYMGQVTGKQKYQLFLLKKKFVVLLLAFYRYKHIGLCKIN